MSDERHDRWCPFDPENRRKPPEYPADRVENPDVMTEYLRIDAESARN